MMRQPSGDTGTALVHVILLLTVVSAVAAGAAALARIEVAVSAAQRTDRDAAYAAQAVLAAAVRELDALADWDGALAGVRHAAFSDGAASSPRQIPGGGQVLVCCGGDSATARVDAETGMTWRPFAWQSLAALLGVADAARHYVVAWVADDPDDPDGNPQTDTNDRVLVRAEAITPSGGRKGVNVLIQRAPLDPATRTRAAGLEILSWHELR